MNFLINLFKNTKNIEKKQFNPSQFAMTTTPSRAIWNPQDYYHYCNEAYYKNPIVYSCIRMTSDGAARIPFKAYINDKSDKQHPVNNLLTSPNPEQSGFAFRAKLFGFLQISGNSYIHCLQKNDKKPEQLHIMRPDRIQIISNELGHISHYKYQITGTIDDKYLQAEEIIHLKYFSPDDDYYGTAPLASAMRANDTHNKAADFQKSLLDNAARPSGCLIYKGNDDNPNLTPQQFERIKSELETHYAGSAHAGRPMVLEGGLDWKPMGFSPSDMEFSALKHNTSRDIALAFGVPPMMLGIPGDNTYSNYQEAVRVFTRNTLIPMSEMLYEALSRKLSIYYSQNIKIKPDTEGIPAFLPEKEAHRNFIASANFLSDEEKKDLLF